MKRQVLGGSGLPHALLIGKTGPEPYQNILNLVLKCKAPCEGMGLKEQVGREFRGCVAEDIVFGWAYHRG